MEALRKCFCNLFFLICATILYHNPSYSYNPLVHSVHWSHPTLTKLRFVVLVVDSEVDNVANEVTEMVVVNMEVDKVANMEVTWRWTWR